MAEVDDQEIAPCAPEDAWWELRRCIAKATFALEDLASEFPNATILGCCGSGEAMGIVVLISSTTHLHCSPVAPDRLKSLAQIIGHLPPDLRRKFQLELELVPHSEPEPEKLHELKYWRI